MNLGRALFVLATDTKAFEKDLQEAKEMARAASGDIQKHFNAVATDIERHQKAQANTLKNMETLGTAMTVGVTLPILAVGAAAVKSFTDFNSAMTGSLAIMEGVDSKMRARLEGTAREVAKTTMFSAKQAAESYYFLAGAGLDAGQSMQALPLMARFAQAGMFDMARATDLLTDAQSALGLTIRDDVVKNMENMTRVSDVLVKAGNLSNASIEQFSEALTTRAGAGLRLLNKEMEEGVAVLAVFADQGIKGAEAGEKLDIVMRDLQTSSLKNTEAWNAFGLSVYDQSGNMRNLADIVQQLETRFAGASDEQLRLSLMALGFQDRSVAGIVSLLGYSGAIRQYEQQLKSAGGVTQEVADKQMQSAAVQFALFKAEVVDVAIVLGSALVPILLVGIDTMRPVVAVTAEAAEAFASLPQPLQMATVGVVGFVAVLGPGLHLLSMLIRLNPVVALGLRAVGAAAGMGGAAGGMSVFAGSMVRTLGVIGLVISAAVLLDNTLRSLGVTGGTMELGAASMSPEQFDKKVPDWAKGKLEKQYGITRETSTRDSTRTDLADPATLAMKEIEKSIQGLGVTSQEANPDLDSLLNSLKDTGDAAGGGGGGAAAKLNILEDGIISFAEAVEEGMSAMVAGAVEAEDSLARGMDAVAEKAFNTEKTLAKLAYTLEKDEQAGRRLVLALAEDALNKTRSATQAIFQTPTREQTALDLSQAQFRVGQIQLQFAISPQIDRLRDALEDLRGSADEQTRSLDTSSRTLADRLDALKESTEKQLEAMDQLIEAAREEAEARRTAMQREQEDDRYEIDKRRRELQAELEDTQKTVAVTNQERLARGQHIDSLEAALKSLDDAEFELQRTFTLRARELEDSTKAELDAMEEQRDQLEESTRAQEKAIERQIDAIDKQKRAIQESTESQSRAIQKSIEGLEENLEAYDRNGKAVEFQSTLLRAQHEVMRLSIDAQDATRLSEEELALKTNELREMTLAQSTTVRDLTKQLGDELIPEFREAKEASDLLGQAMALLNDVSLRQNLIPNVDAAAIRAGILARSMEEGAGAVGGAAGRLATTVDDIGTQLQAVVDDYKDATSESWQTFDSNMDVLYGTISATLADSNNAYATSVAELASSHARSEAFAGNDYGPEGTPLGHNDLDNVFSSDASSHRAMGGPVGAGRPYMVGEGGQELFIPTVAGMILDHAESMRRLRDYRAFAESFRRPSVSTISNGRGGGSGAVELNFNGPVTIQAGSRGEAERSAENFGWGIAATMRSRGVRP